MIDLIGKIDKIIGEIKFKWTSIGNKIFKQKRGKNQILQGNNSKAEIFNIEGDRNVLNFNNNFHVIPRKGITHEFLQELFNNTVKAGRESGFFTNEYFKKVIGWDDSYKNIRVLEGWINDDQYRTKDCIDHIHIEIGGMLSVLADQSLPQRSEIITTHMNRDFIVCFKMSKNSGDVMVEKIYPVDYSKQ